jgi:hypothetical protein
MLCLVLPLQVLAYDRMETHNASQKLHLLLDTLFNYEQELPYHYQEQLREMLNSTLEDLEQTLGYPYQLKDLRHIHKTLQEQWLKTHVPQATLRNLVDKGHFDCVTGTLLYSLILSSLDIDFVLHETAFHAFLTIHLGKREILIETTDPVYGLVVTPAVIHDKKQTYQRAAMEQSRADREVFGKVSADILDLQFQELCGLYYFNLAVRNFNTQQYKKSKYFVGKAIHFYPQSGKINAFRAFLNDHVKVYTVSM